MEVELNCQIDVTYDIGYLTPLAVHLAVITSNEIRCYGVLLSSSDLHEAWWVKWQVGKLATDGVVSPCKCKKVVV